LKSLPYANWVLWSNSCVELSILAYFDANVNFDTLDAREIVD
jgi:hypothetical protein